MLRLTNHARRPARRPLLTLAAGLVLVVGSAAAPAAEIACVSPVTSISDLE